MHRVESEACDSLPFSARLVTVPTPRWTAISVSAFASEAEASAWHRDRLLDSESYRGSSNFEFVEGDGSVNEVESLILTPTELLLVKLKSRLGTVQADLGSVQLLGQLLVRGGQGRDLRGHICGGGRRGGAAGGGGCRGTG